MSKILIDTSIGILIAEANADGIISLEFESEKLIRKSSPENLFATKKNHHLINLQVQLLEYFSGKRKQFELLLNPVGTTFQTKVWKELLNIPYGKTKSYLQQSISIGDKKAVRAVAAANRANPIAIIIPCHRVIAGNGKLTGYAGGLWRKKWLLDFERANSMNEKQLTLMELGNE